MWEKHRSVTRCVVLLFVCLWVHGASILPALPAKCHPSLIALYEAEILIYLLPQAQQIRSDGFDIGWDLQTSAKLNQADYYIFFVINAKRPSYGSVTVGYFGVNKHTADVWSLDREGEIISSTEIQGVQRILRQAHCIDQATVDRYRSAKPDLM